MELPSPRYYQASSTFTSSGEPPLEANRRCYDKNKENPLAEAFLDPLCKLNLKETSEFVKSLPMSNNGIIEAPSTPGRPIFRFSSGNFARKSFPSKWDDAEKWLISTSSYIDSPAHTVKPSESVKVAEQCENFKHQMEAFAEHSRVSEEKCTQGVSNFNASAILDHHSLGRNCDGVSAGSTDTLLKDKFSDSVEPILPSFGTSKPTKEGFVLKNMTCETMKDACTEIVDEVQHIDVGTEMTPLGSSTTSRCHTPIKSSSPARHNTPASRSGSLPSEHSKSSNSTIDIAHFAKLQLGTSYDSVTSNWSSRKEEEEEISKSLRHSETGNGFQKNSPDSRAAAWEEEEKKCCQRYQREEAKILGWVKLQHAKAEAQSTQLEVKIQKMRSKLEEKLMKRMILVNRKAEEWRATAREQHYGKTHHATEHTQEKLNNKHYNSLYCFASHTSCGCFSCNSNHRS